MGCKNSRGQPKLVPMSVKLEQERIAEKKRIPAKNEADHKLLIDKKTALLKNILEKKQAKEKKLAAKKNTEENAKKVAATMDFDCIPKHYALVLKENGDLKQLIIGLDFVTDPPIDMMALMKVLPEYAPAITNVLINMMTPSERSSQEVYQQRVENMKKVMEILNSFPLTELNILVHIDDHDSFQQLKLAAAVNGLVFQDWTMDYRVLGCSDFYPIKRNTSYSRRLRGVYRTEFGAH
ncbi:ddb9a96a-f164-4483-805a-b2f010abedfe [Sclerotinia trifoliorum]|uniref:Ddb9a96a-f164-4483-805a-b2f010abedfe n=1 Tax=Sclerotinia trifoliorum TaxID=28548 RepID=A0A8H2VP92_9HELO|nr:ddb9a96a-f164-4483-805a-b2f010abedfe [Sclerotinia trifoliorum]